MDIKGQDKDSIRFVGRGWFAENKENDDKEVEDQKNVFIVLFQLGFAPFRLILSDI